VDVLAAPFAAGKTRLLAYLPNDEILELKKLPVKRAGDCPDRSYRLEQAAVIGDTMTASNKEAA
jgi:hypothetical protein